MKKILRKHMFGLSVSEILILLLVLAIVGTIIRADSRFAREQAERRATASAVLENQ